MIKITNPVEGFLKKHKGAFYSHGLTLILFKQVITFMAVDARDVEG